MWQLDAVMFIFPLLIFYTLIRVPEFFNFIYIPDAHFKKNSF